MKTQAILQAAEGSGKAPIQVDSEGGVKAKESRTRFIAPVIAVVIASQAGYEGRHPDREVLLRNWGAASGTVEGHADHAHQSLQRPPFSR
jgi:hypothetical protein